MLYLIFAIVLVFAACMIFLGYKYSTDPIEHRMTYRQFIDWCDDVRFCRRMSACQIETTDRIRKNIESNPKRKWNKIWYDQYEEWTMENIVNPVRKIWG